MLDKWLTALLKPDLAPNLLKEELDRLQAGGYLSAEDVDRLYRECSASLTEGAERTRRAILPLLEAAGSTVRGALDLPSRSEIVALTEALRARQDDLPSES